MTTDEIKQLAHLARIEVTDAEIAGYAKDFDSILAYVDQINQVVLPETHPGHLQVNQGRPDQDPNESGRYQEAMLADAPASQDGFYKVPKIL